MGKTSCKCKSLPCINGLGIGAFQGGGSSPYESMNSAVSRTDPVTARLLNTIFMVNTKNNYSGEEEEEVISVCLPTSVFANSQQWPVRVQQ